MLEIEGVCNHDISYFSYNSRVLYDVLGRRKGALIGYAVLITATFIASAPTNEYVFIACRVLQGMGLGWIGAFYRAGDSISLISVYKLMTKVMSHITQLMAVTIPQGWGCLPASLACSC